MRSPTQQAWELVTLPCDAAGLSPAEGILQEQQVGGSFPAVCPRGLLGSERCHLSWELLPSASVLQRNVNTLSLLLVRRVINTLVSRWSRAPHRYNPSTEKNPEEFLSQAPSVRGRCDGWDWRHLSVAFTPVLSRRRRQQACLGSGAERRQPSHPPARGERSGASPSPGRGSEPGTNVACVVGRAASRGSREQNTDLTRSSAESPECIKQSPAARAARKGRHEASGLSGRYVRAAAV